MVFFFSSCLHFSQEGLINNEDFNFLNFLLTVKSV